MKKLYNIVLHPNVDQHEFLHEVLGENCHCVDECENIPNVIVLQMEESRAAELRTHSSVYRVEEELTPEPADLSSFFLTNKTFTGSFPPTGQNPKNYGPLQFYFFNNQLNSNGLNIGTHANDNSPQITGSYYSCWLGKHVDIVTLEVSGSKNTAVLTTPHPDFVKLGTASTVKFIPNNWTGLSNSENINQVGNTSLLTSHAIGVLSAAAGTYCGYAKESNLYALYLETVAGCVNSVINWHNAKSINPVTGLKNPTILIYEFQYLYNHSTLYKISNITQFTYYNTSLQSYETITRPAGGWGTDFTPFSSRNFNIKRVLEGGSYHWCIGVSVDENTAISNAIKSSYDNGIINVVAAGNQGGVYVKHNDPNFNASITIESGATYFTVSANGSGALVSTSGPTVGTTTVYPFRHYGPNGSPFAIDVAAGQNSQRYSILDHYSNRGPGIDITGLGVKTFTSYPSTLCADGNYWGMFSGTSCAAPTVAGVLACLLEKYYYYHDAWPTPQQAKELLLSEAKKEVLSIATATTWATVPAPGSAIQSVEVAGGPIQILFIYDNISLNGGVSTNELQGTPNIRAFIDASVNKIKVTKGTRPATGQVYPRSKIKIG